MAGVPGMDNEFSSNWQASWVDGGTPGAANSSAFGCNDASACNYNPTAYLADNDACAYDCYGCTYPTTENYTNGATIDDGTCTFSVIAENNCHLILTETVQFLLVTFCCSYQRLELSVTKRKQNK